MDPKLSQEIVEIIIDLASDELGMSTIELTPDLLICIAPNPHPTSSGSSLCFLASRNCP